jgi:hypothetical protein
MRGRWRGQENMSDQISTVFFPLRTNVQYFETPKEFLSLEARIKQASILYDRIVFESGFYVATMGPDGVFDNYLPETNRPTPDQLETFARLKSEPGSFTISVQPDPTKPFTPLLTSPIERFFVSEFHTLIDRLTSELDFDGVESAPVSLSKEGKEYAARLAREYLDAEGAILPEGSPRVQGKIMQNLFGDLVLTSALGYANSVDPLHAPILERVIRGTGQGYSARGFAALEFEVPNAANLPWETVAEVRAHPAIVEYRQRLFKAENTVRYMLLEASESDIKLEVAKELGQEHIDKAIAGIRSRGRELAGSVVWQVAGGLFPPLGAVQTALSVGKDVADWNRERKTWLAVLAKLRGPIEIRNA